MAVMGGRYCECDERTGFSSMLKEKKSNVSRRRGVNCVVPFHNESTGF